MPAWGEILAELTPGPDPATGMLRPPDYDGVRHKYLDRLHKLTGRSTVVYYSDWLNNSGPLTPITLKDMAGFMPGPSLDPILHSPGGQAEATFLGYLHAVQVPRCARLRAVGGDVSVDDVGASRRPDLHGQALPTWTH